MYHKAVAETRLKPNVRVRIYKENALKALELMHEAINAGEYKLAKHHNIVANIAIDQMINVSKPMRATGEKKGKAL